jgi:hypothetical protein
MNNASLFIDTTLVGAKHNCEQVEVKRFFHRNPFPSCIKIINNDEEQPQLRIPICSGGTPMNENPSMATAPSTSILAAIAAIPATVIPPKEFFTQLINTMKNLQAPQQPTKIVIESRDHTEIINLAKLQTSMLQIMYAHGKMIGMMDPLKISA